MLHKRFFFLPVLVFILSLAAVNAYAVNARIGLLNASFKDPSSKTGMSNIVMDEIPGVGRYSPGLVRTRAFWPCFEQQQGVFTFQECFQDNNIRQLAESGFKISLVMMTRTDVSKGLPADFWGTHKDGMISYQGVSFPPNDLSDVWSDDYGYSLNYYSFLKTFLQHYSDIGIIFDSVQIENEANSDDYFIGTPDDPEASMDQYIRMVATAKKAVADLGLSSITKVYDSGLTAVSILAINDYVRDNRLYDAWLLYRKVFGPTDNSPASMENYAASMLTKYYVRAAKYLIEDPNSLIFQGGMADGLNFHYFKYPEGIPETVAYLRRMVPEGFPVVTSAMGTSGLPGDLAARRDLASRIMLEDYSAMLNYSDGQVIWYTGPAPIDGGETPDGVIVDSTQNLVLPLAIQYKQVLDIFNGKIRSSMDLSGSETMRFDKKFSNREVSVAWARPEAQSITSIATTRDNCTVTDSTGTVIPAGSYYTMGPSHPFVTICYFVTPAPSSKPPVLEFVPDYSRPALEPFSITIEATDPNGTGPTLSASGLPQGATFAFKAPGIRVLSWTPTKDQVGQYNITLTASDGVLSTSQVMDLTITPPEDTDGDGLADVWELQNLFTLNRTGSLDQDKDGISNLREYQLGLDPLVSDAPSSPSILAPQAGAEVATFRPILKVKNGTDPQSMPLTVLFQIAAYSDRKMTNILASRVISAGTLGETSWQVPTGVLKENTSYRWRAFMKNKYTKSLPAVSDFFVDTVNEPPKYFSMVSPAAGAELKTTTPILTVKKAIDPDGDVMTYGFAVYAEDKATIVASVSGLPQADTISWRVDPPLKDNAHYFWQGIATDSHGMKAATLLRPFDVNLSNDPPVAVDIPVIATEDKAVAFFLGATDADGDPVTYSIVTPPSHGTVTGVPPKMLYTPARDYSGPDSLTYKAGDGTLDSNTATVTITVSAVNDKPTITPIGPITINANQSAGPVDFVIGDADNTFSQLTVTANTFSAGLLPADSIVLGGSGANRTIKVTPAPGKSGEAKIFVTVSDGVESASTVLLLTVLP